MESSNSYPKKLIHPHNMYGSHSIEVVNISKVNKKTYSAFDKSLALTFSKPSSDERSCSRADVTVKIIMLTFETKYPE